VDNLVEQLDLHQATHVPRYDEGQLVYDLT
jgi:hypothetical protein